MKLTLKAARINKGLNQQEAAQKLNISKSTLSHYERGERFPDVPTIMKIEKLYDIGFSDIIFLQ